MVGILTKNSPEKSNAPHITGVPSLGLNIDRCIMSSTRKRRSRSRLGHDKWDIPAFDNVLLQSNLGSPGQNYLIIITTDINVMYFGTVASKKLKNKERKVDFRFVERKFLAAINLTRNVEGALVPVLLHITHWTKSGLPVSPPGLFPP